MATSSNAPTGLYPTLDLMRTHGVPLTREAYLEREFQLYEGAWGSEQEAELPDDFQRYPPEPPHWIQQPDPPSLPVFPPLSNPSARSFDDEIVDEMQRLNPSLTAEEIKDFLASSGL